MPLAFSSCAFSTWRGDGATGEPSCHCTSQSTSTVASCHGHPPQRPEVGLEPEVAVAALPARHRVARHRVHLHLEREQVVAALDLVAGVELLEEELRVEALAHQAALHVGERGDDRVDRPRLDVRPQFLDFQHKTEPISLKPSDRRG